MASGFTGIDYLFSASGPGSVSGLPAGIIAEQAKAIVNGEGGIASGILTADTTGTYELMVEGQVSDTTLGVLLGDAFDYTLVVTERSTGNALVNTIIQGAGITASFETLFAFAGLALVAGVAYDYEIRRKKRQNAGGSMKLATGIVAMGDARYHTRHEFADTATTEQIVAFFTATALLSEAKLISVMVSVFYDGTNIPSADPNAEYRGKLLLQYPSGPQVVELPCLMTLDGITAWFNENKAALIDKVGDAPTSIIQADLRSERKARGR